MVVIMAELVVGYIPIITVIMFVMKVVSSLKSLKKRDKNCRLIKRHGRSIVINKIHKRFKAKQA